MFGVPGRDRARPRSAADRAFGVWVGVVRTRKDRDPCGSRSDRTTFFWLFCGNDEHSRADLRALVGVRETLNGSRGLFSDRDELVNLDTLTDASLSGTACAVR